MKKKEASWRRLGASWRRKNPLDALVPLLPLAVACTQRPLLRIPQDFFTIFSDISLVLPKIKEVKKDKRR